MKKAMVILLMVFISVCVVFTPSVFAKDKITVGAVLFSTEIEWFYLLDQQYKKVAEEMGMELISADGQLELGKQVEIVETFISRGVDAILISPISADGVKAVCEEAIAKGIYVLVQGHERDQVDWSTANFGYNEADMGRLSGEIAAERVQELYGDNESVKVAVLGSDGWAASPIRMGGAKKALMDNVKGPEFKFVIEQNGDTIETAFNVMESALQQHPDLRTVLVINDDAAIGAVGAFESAGIDILKEGCITGVGNNKGTWEYIKSGKILGSVDLNHYGTARVAMEAVQSLMDGGKVPEMLYIDMIKTNKDNCDNVNP